MNRSQILAMSLVDRLIAVGSPIAAISDREFIVTDSAVPESIDVQIIAIIEEFRPLEPLRPYIVTYLRQLGREIRLAAPAQVKSRRAVH